MMMSIKRLLYLLPFLALTGCSTADEDALDGSSRQPLLLRAVQSTAPQTRAADGLYTASTGFDGTETVKVFLGEACADYSVGAADADDSYRSALTPASTRLYYPSGTEGSVTVYAVYPSASAPATAEASATGTHTVAYDQSQSDLGTANYKASDLMYVRNVVSLSEKTTQQVLSFTHQLVKLTLNITKAADVASITKVELKHVKRQATVAADATSMTLSHLVTATGDDAAAGDNILVMSDITDTEAHTGAVLFPAQAWDDADFLEITAGNGETAVWQLTKSDWTPGAAYTMTFTVDASTLGVTAAITNWTPEGAVTAVPKYRMVIADIPDQTYTGSAVIPDPEPAVTYNGALLEKGTDYYFVYSDNTAAGTATVTAVGINGHAGQTATKTFQIIE